MARVKAFCTERYRVLVVGVRTFDPSPLSLPKTTIADICPRLRLRFQGYRLRLGWDWVRRSDVRDGSFRWGRCPGGGGCPTFVVSRAMYCRPYTDVASVSPVRCRALSLTPHYRRTDHCNRILPHSKLATHNAASYHCQQSPSRTLTLMYFAYSL